MGRQPELDKDEQKELLVYLYALRMVDNPDTGKPHTPKEISAVAGAAEGWYHNAMKRGGSSKHFFIKIQKYVKKLRIRKDIMFEAQMQVASRATAEAIRKPRRRLKPQEKTVFDVIDHKYDHLKDKHPDISEEFIAGNVGVKPAPVVVQQTVEEFVASHQELDEKLRSLYDEFHALAQTAPAGLRSLMKLKEEAFTEFVLTYAGE